LYIFIYLTSVTIGENHILIKISDIADIKLRDPNRICKE